MRITKTLTEKAILGEFGQRIARRRVDRNLTQAELAREAGVSKRTVERVEAGVSAQLSNLVRLFRALDVLDGVDALIPESMPSPIEQLRTRGKERKRASAARRARLHGNKWTWGE